MNEMSFADFGASIYVGEFKIPPDIEVTKVYDSISGVLPPPYTANAHNTQSRLEQVWIQYVEPTELPLEYSLGDHPSLVFRRSDTGELVEVRGGIGTDSAGRYIGVNFEKPSSWAVFYAFSLYAIKSESGVERWHNPAFV